MSRKHICESHSLYVCPNIANLALFIFFLHYYWDLRPEQHTPTRDMLNCDKLKMIAIAIGIRDRIEAAFP
jgi:hypothetical protein